MTNPAPSGGDIFDVKKVRRLVELMKEHDLAEVDLRQGEQRVRIRRGAEAFFAQTPMMAAPAVSSQAAPAAGGGESKAAAPATGGDYAVIKSPMVGTFYASSSPESPPFLKVGDHVGPDSIVCIIEAMKVFNEIPAEMSGKVVAVLVENGAPVEFNQPLFKIDAKK
jgi:acetyl-CoA carboxylase biotin carboxyl carrier protein